MKKKSCYDCKALYGGMCEHWCMLRYKIIEQPKFIEHVGKLWVPVPAEECPKPRTFEQLRNAEFKRA